MMKGNKDTEWTEESEKEFTKLKRYLATPPVLFKSEHGEPLYIYIAVSHAVVSSVLALIPTRRVVVFTYMHLMY